MWPCPRGLPTPKLLVPPPCGGHQCHRCSRGAYPSPCTWAGPRSHALCLGRPGAHGAVMNLRTASPDADKQGGSPSASRSELVSRGGSAWPPSRCPDVAWHQLGHVVPIPSRSSSSVFPEHRRSFHVEAAPAGFSGRKGRKGSRRGQGETCGRRRLVIWATKPPSHLEASQRPRMSLRPPLGTHGSQGHLEAQG